jgi:hypothetical protein
VAQLVDSGTPSAVGFSAPPGESAPRHWLLGGRGVWVFQRARLIAEIIAAYLRAQRQLGQAPIASVVEVLRSEASPMRPTDHNASAEAQRLGRAVVRTLALLPGDTRCLRRSLVLVQLLARRRISARLVIAVRSEPSFLAHAWVEHRGEPLLSPADDSFARLVEL